MNNLLSYCGLVDAKLRASDKAVHSEHIFWMLLDTVQCANHCCVCATELSCNSSRQNKKNLGSSLIKHAIQIL